MNVDEDDPVIKEIPVYLAKGLSDKLTLFQYPLRPVQDGYDKAEFLNVQMKPNNQEVKMELALDLDSEHYDASVGENFAMRIEKEKDDQTEKTKFFKGNYMDKIVLQSTRAEPKSNELIGVYHEGELHLTTLKNVLQIRTFFNHLDESDKKKDDGKNLGDVSEEEDAPRQVNVTFARNLPDHIKKIREQSFAHQSQNPTDQFIEVQYNPVNSSKAKLTKLEMFCQSTEENANLFSSVTEKQFLDLMSATVKEKSSNKVGTSSINHICTLANIPLLDHIRILLKNTKVFSFNQLRSIIPSEHETNAILKYLQQVAVLVQGNWVINSDLEYPKDTISFYSGIPAELMCRARDYILLLFTENKYVDKKAVSSVVKLPVEEMQELLVNLAKHQPKKGWKMIVPPSKDFAERYPEIAQRQETFWEARKKQLRISMKSHSFLAQQSSTSTTKVSKSNK